MTQLTMPQRAAAPVAGTPAGVGRDVMGRDGVGWDGADLATAVRALEARNALLAGAVAALDARDAVAAGLFETVLADPSARLWPFDLARVHLLYGERLRQTAEISRSRQHLRTARAAFEQLGATAWAERAAAELAAVELAAVELAAAERAAAEVPAAEPARRQAPVGYAEPLTAQERQVAELAAAGLSNKQIAARLFMSHRTVGSHLYRIFPKLGIESRAALRDALSARAAA